VIAAGRKNGRGTDTGIGPLAVGLEDRRWPGSCLLGRNMAGGWADGRWPGIWPLDGGQAKRYSKSRLTNEATTG